MVKPEACGFFSFFSCPNKKRTCFSLLFSLRRKAPKDSLRLPPQTPIHLLESNTHGSKVLQCSQGSHRPPLPVRRVTAAGKFAPAGARRAPCERSPVRCRRKGRRLTDHASIASVDAVFHSRHRTAAGRRNGQAEGLRLLFVLFLYEQEKNMFLSFPKEKEKQQEHTCSAPAVLFLQSYQSLIKGSSAT